MNTGNRIIFFADPVEGLETYKTSEECLKFIEQIIEQKALNIGAYPNGDVCAPSMNFHITTKSAKGMRVTISQNLISRLGHKAGDFGTVPITDIEYKNIRSKIVAAYPECARAVDLFNKTFNKK